MAGNDKTKRAEQVFDWRNAGWTHPQIQAELGISHQTLWKIIKSPEYEKLVESLEDTARMIHSKPELFKSLMKELKNN